MELTRFHPPFRRVAILFAGGPAPAANAVISTAAASFLKVGTEVVGIRYGYANLVADRPEGLQAGVDYVLLTRKTLARSRNSQGIILGTSRTNPGKYIHGPADLDDPAKTAPLRRVYDALRSIGVEALVSIGGDDTLKTANKLRLVQQRTPEAGPAIPIVHLPKTIDNDYHGIDFTFGYFTAVDFLAAEIRNLIHDAEAVRAYFIAETMGRSAGWLAYGAAIAGEASLVLSVEDITGPYRTEETLVDSAGQRQVRPIMRLDRVVDWIVRLMLAREKEEKYFGVIVLAEGLAELLPNQYVRGVPRDEHGHLSISQIDLCDVFSQLVSEGYQAATGRKPKIKGVQLGYESRCAKPHAFDVMLGSQLGVGAYLALAERGFDGVMVTVSGQLELAYRRFDSLIDPETLATVVRYITPGSDFHRLARLLETDVSH